MKSSNSPQTSLRLLGALAATAALALALAACAPADSEDGAPTDPAQALEVDHDGPGPRPPLPTPLSEEEIAGLPEIGGRGPDNVSGADDLIAASCWVSISWCRNPNTGKPSGTATAACTRPAPIFASLIREVCGNVSFSSTSCVRKTTGGSWTCTAQ